MLRIRWLSIKLQKPDELISHCSSGEDFFPQTSDLKKKKKKERKEKEKKNRAKKERKKVNIKFNNVLVLISITMLSGSTQVFLTRGSGVKSLHLPAKRDIFPGSANNHTTVCFINASSGATQPASSPLTGRCRGYRMEQPAATHQFRVHCLKVQFFLFYSNHKVNLIMMLYYYST